MRAPAAGPRRARSPRLRGVKLLALAAAGVLGATGIAHGGTQVSQNACHYAFDNAWRNLDVSLTGTASPLSVTPGQQVTLTGASAYVALPSWIPQYGYNAGLLKEGTNEIPVRAWLALAGSNTAEGVQVIPITATATTTVVATGGTFRSGTAPVMNVPLPDTTWTAGGEDTVAFSQAGPGSLPGGLPAAGGQTVTPRGSLYVNAALSGGGGLAFVMDCQPGRFVEPEGATFLPLAPAVFENAHVAGGTPAPPPPQAVARVTLRPTPFTATRRQVRVPLMNAGNAVGTGRLVVQTAARVRLTPRARPVIVTIATGTYSVRPGAQPMRVLNLTPAGRLLMATRPAIRTRVVIRPATGTVVNRAVVLRGPRFGR